MSNRSSLVASGPAIGARAAPSLRPHAHGVAALAMVMVLLFIMALVSAYANRNLIVEQRIATNAYYSERSAAAADAGLDWTLALLNAGRLDGNCNPTSDAAQSSFRSRYLGRTSDGSYALAAGNAVLRPSCAMNAQGLTCICPTQADPAPAVNPVRDWSQAVQASAFRASLLKDSAIAPGTLLVEVLGCGSPGNGSTSCFASDSPRVDGRSLVRASIGLVRALPQAPPAALTTGGSVQVDGLLTVSNPDGPTGMTVHAGGSVSGPGTLQLSGPAGASDNGLLDGDSQLANLQPAVSDRFTDSDIFFRSVFGMPAPLYRDQPGVVRINCSSGCGMAQLDLAVNRYPGLTLWFEGNLTLDAPSSLAALGTQAEPVMIIVTGDLSAQSTFDLTGFIYATRLNWTSAASSAIVRGAVMTVENSVVDSATLLYDGEAMRNIQYYYGSFVRAPAGWDKPSL